MADVFDDRDTELMLLALTLAANGEGRVSPNPPVGCVLVRDGEIVGRGWHNRYGELHAEAMALLDARERAEGATAYVTLAPCCTAGRQPPCTDALIRAGVAEVVVAAEDPNPKNASGLDVLRRAGLRTRAGLLRPEAEYAARGFFKRMRRGLPYVTMKYAVTLDGKIAAASGDSRWVSGPESRQFVQDMRSRHDAIMVGSGTVEADDPLLNVREPVLSQRGGRMTHPQPHRVVVDSRCRLSPGAAMLNPANTAGGKVIVATTDKALVTDVTALEQAGAVVLRLPSTDDGRVRMDALMKELVMRGVNMIQCESGGRLAASMLRAGLVDEIVAFIAPKIVGGENAPGPIGDLGITLMAKAVELDVLDCTAIGGDLMVRAALARRKGIP